MRVATAIGARYGIPPQQLAQRLSAGRFRVKADIDRDTADRLVADLEAMGAVCSMADDSGRMIPPASAAAAPVQPPSSPPARAATAPPASPPVQEYQSGLAAALSNSAQADLGALSEGWAMSLATLDGEDDSPPPAASVDAPGFAPANFGPPEDAEPALQLAINIRPGKPAPAQARRPAPPPSSPPADTPSLGSAVKGITVPGGLEHANTGTPDADLSPTGIRTPEEKPAAPRRPSMALPPRPSAQVTSVGPENPLQRVMRLLSDTPRVRFIAGIALALFLGFVPAHIFASLRESSAYAEIDTSVREAQQDIRDLDEWNQLDQVRTKLLARKESKQLNIAMSGMFIWAAASAGIGYLWFRKLPW